MDKERTTRNILEEHIDTVWRAYLILLLEHNIPLPEDMTAAKLYFRGGYVYCMGEYLQEKVS